MKREFAIRFLPPGRHDGVPIAAYAKTLADLAEGFAALRDKVVGKLSARYDTPREEVKSCLAVEIRSPRKGSLISPIGWGSPAQIPAHGDTIRSDYWEYLCQELASAASGKPHGGLTGKAARSFSQAGAEMERAGIGLELADRVAGRGEGMRWTSRVDLVRAGDALRVYAQHRSSPMHGTMELIGTIEAPRLRPPCFLLKMDGGEEVTIRFAVDQKKDVKDNWGEDVIVLVSGEINSDGEIVGMPYAQRLHSIVRPKNPYTEYLASRGEGREIWNSPEAREYLASLRRRDD